MQKPMGGMTYMNKRLLDALFLTCRKLRNFQSQSKGKATVDALWVCIHLACGVSFLLIGHTMGEVYHIGVGFCVARSDCDGQCEGLCAWDE